MNEATVIVDGVGMTAPFAARLIASNIHRKCEVEIGAVKCPVWPTVVKDGNLVLVRWHDASGSVRAMARV
jgi:hypothetical protein